MFNLGGWELILLLVVVVIAAIIFGLRRLWANRASSKTIQDATDPKALEEVDDPPTASASELRS